MITENFYELTQKGDLILNMGAGDCDNFWSILNEKNNYISRKRRVAIQCGERIGKKKTRFIYNYF